MSLYPPMSSPSSSPASSASSSPNSSFDLAPPFLDREGEYTSNMLEIAVRVRATFNKDYAGPHDVDDPLYCDVTFSKWAVRAPRGSIIHEDDQTQWAHMAALQHVLRRFILKPPVKPSCPDMVGYISTPPTPAAPMCTYMVWKQNTDNYGLQFLKVGALLGKDQRAKFVRDREYRHSLTAATRLWFCEFGLWIAEDFQGGRPDTLDHPRVVAMDQAMTEDDNEGQVTAQGASSSLPAAPDTEEEEVKIIGQVLARAPPPQVATPPRSNVFVEDALEDEIEVVGPVIHQEVTMEEDAPDQDSMEQDEAQEDVTVTYDPPGQVTTSPPLLQVPSSLVPELDRSFGSDVTNISGVSLGSVADLIGSTTEEELAEVPSRLVPDELDISLASISELLGTTTEDEAADSASDLDTSVELLASVEVIIEEPEP